MNQSGVSELRKLSVIKSISFILIVLSLSGCGTAPPQAPAAPTSTINPFALVDQNGVALNTQVTSAALKVSWISTNSPISIIGGEYSFDGYTYTTLPGIIAKNQSVSVRHTSAATNYTTVDSVLTIGSESDTFSSTTLVLPGLYNVVDTYQTTCFDSATGVAIACIGSGYDADYAGNQPSYSVSANGRTVLDNVTGLRWTQSSDIDNSGAVDYNDKLSQTEAVSYCANLTTDNYTWRLPKVKEAYSLILFNGRDASSYTGTDTTTLKPFIDIKFDWVFGDLTTTQGIAAGDRLIDAQYATSTIYRSTTMNGDRTMFGVNYVDGRIKGYPTAIKKYYVRCVTGNSSYGENLFVDNGDLTITDQATGLMWQKDDTAATDWDNAVLTCENATTATYADWRLPNVKELQSIVNYWRSPDTESSAAIDPVFKATAITNEKGVTDWGYYWASTTHMNNAGNGTNATYVSFGRALGYFMSSILDVHGAGAQRSNDKLDVATQAGATAANIGHGTFYHHGPQGDILRLNNKVRCVR